MDVARLEKGRQEVVVTTYSLDRACIMMFNL
jgi:hypothetical protein